MDAGAWAQRLESVEGLDAPARAAARVVHRATRSRAVKDALSGRWLGHSVHPMLTDLPIGFWTSAWVLDLACAPRYRDAARVLVALGVLSALPAIATGASDWSDTDGGDRRVGLVHAAANSSAFALYAASWVARRRGRHGVGVALGMVGAAAATAGGYLGGHLVEGRGVGVNRPR